MGIKKIGVITLSSALILSGVIPTKNVLAAQASSIEVTKPVEVGQSSESKVMDVEADNLIKKVRSLFPNQFNFVKDSDFHVATNVFRPDNQMESYHLDFFKEVAGGKGINASFEFAGKDLSLVSFYYNPADVSDALYPPKVTKTEAQTIAMKFLDKLNLKSYYQLSKRDVNYIPNFNRPLTEPIEYQFMFDKLENGVAVENQNVNITVLGNGEVSQFYRGSLTENVTFESNNNIIPREEALQLLKDHYSIDLQYSIDYNYQNKKPSLKLMYMPAPFLSGVHAKTKEFKIGNKFTKEMPKAKKITMLSSKTTQKQLQPLTKEEAKTIAEKLLKPKDNNVKLTIEGIQEEERNGSKIYSIQFMYYRGSSGSGSRLEINKLTGEILNYYSENRHFYFNENYKNKDHEPKLSKDEALNKAIDYIKQYANANMDQFAYPIEDIEQDFRKDMNEYYFNFPRVKDGIIVNGNGINVSVSAEDGELYSINVNYSELDQWPDVKKAVDKQIALETIKNNLDVQLTYANNGENEPYKLIYAVRMKDENSYFDAILGKWEKYVYAGDSPTEGKELFNHHWAAKELNHLLQANIIKTEDPEKLNPDKAVTKGEALEIMYNSLTYNYRDFREQENSRHQTFADIKPDHPLFDLVERAVDQKIIDPTESTFNADEKLTKEELAFWYARALGLQTIADHKEIYNMNFADIKQMSEQYKGHIALVNALGIISKNKNNEFQPKKEVSLAEIAVSTMRLAKNAAEMNIHFR